MLRGSRNGDRLGRARAGRRRPVVLEHRDVGLLLLLHELGKPNVMDEYAKGKIFIRDLPKQQSLEEWNQAFTEFKNL